eukprot:339083-Alexandrium_andersonii.AAC.1
MLHGQVPWNGWLHAPERGRAVRASGCGWCLSSKGRLGHGPEGGRCRLHAGPKGAGSAVSARAEGLRRRASRRDEVPWYELAEVDTTVSQSAEAGVGRGARDGLRHPTMGAGPDGCMAGQPSGGYRMPTLARWRAVRPPPHRGLRCPAPQRRNSSEPMAARHACWIKSAGHGSGHTAVQTRMFQDKLTCAEALMPSTEAPPRTPGSAVEDMREPSLLHPSPPSANGNP